MKIALATTTINVPSLLEKYAEQAKEVIAEGVHEIFFVIAGDRKTPHQAKVFCQDLQKSSKIEVTFLDPDSQRQLLVDNKALDAHLDWDCIQRRNLAGLYSLKRDAELVIYIDDDNFIENGNYFKDHISVFSNPPKNALFSTNGFYNIMTNSIGSRTGDWLYPRGYPFSIRDKSHELSEKSNSRSVGVNAGLWVEEPDIDAISRITGRPLVHSYNIRENLALDKGIWTPINSQNTAFLADLLPAYFLSSKVGRYDDIYAGYILQKVMEKLDLAVCFGNPIVRQKRNEHDLFVDLENELLGMKNIDYLIECLREIELKSHGIQNICDEITSIFINLIYELPRNHIAKMDLQNLALGMKLWLESIYS